MKKVVKANLQTEIAASTANIKKLKKDYDAQPNETVKEALYKVIDEAEKNHAELLAELDELNSEQKNSAKGTLASLIKANHLAYIASDAKYLLVKNYSTTEKRVNLQTEFIEPGKIQGVLNILQGVPGAFASLEAAELRTEFEKNNASYMIKTASFDEPKWDRKYVFNLLDVQRDYWAPIDRGDAYSEVFDDLMHSLCGGKKENIDHLEKWVAYKYMYPEKCKITPGLNITGKPGGNGKGLFSVLLTSIFTPMGVTLVRGKNLVGGFNQIMEGKVITILDDESKDKFPQDELKQNSGNGSLVIEPKGVDAYSVDATNSMIVMDNVGLVKLVGGGSGGEDRRWSIILTELTLLEELQKKHGITQDEAKQYAEQMGETFSDRIECGKWVAHLIKKHDIKNMPVLLPLHGQDYNNRLLEQRDNYTDVFERILPIMVNQGLFPFKFLKEIIEAETGEKIRKPATLSSRFDEFLSRKGHKNVEKADVNIKITYEGSGTSEKFKGAIRRIDPLADTFDYSLISSKLYSKKDALQKDTVQIHDFEENDRVNSDLQNQPRYPATPLSHAVTSINAASSGSGVKNGDPAKNQLTPLKSPKTTLEDMLAKIKKDKNNE